MICPNARPSMPVPAIFKVSIVLIIYKWGLIILSKQTLFIEMYNASIYRHSSIWKVIDQRCAKNCTNSHRLVDCCGIEKILGHWTFYADGVERFMLSAPKQVRYNQMLISSLASTIKATNSSYNDFCTIWRCHLTFVVNNKRLELFMCTRFSKMWWTIRFIQWIFQHQSNSPHPRDLSGFKCTIFRKMINSEIDFSIVLNKFHTNEPHRSENCAKHQSPHNRMDVC